MRYIVRSTVSAMVGIALIVGLTPAIAVAAPITVTCNDARRDKVTVIGIHGFHDNSGGMGPLGRAIERQRDWLYYTFDYSPNHHNWITNPL